MISFIKLKVFIFSLLLILITYRTINSQSYYIKNYSIEDGLPTNLVYDVTQDLKGRMWFATASGVSVYDGFFWKNLDTINKLPNLSFRKILIDEKGIIWCIPSVIRDKLVFFNNDSINTIIFPQLTLDDTINITSFGIIYENDNPILCIGTYKGIFLYKDKEWKRYLKNDGLLDDYILSVTAFQSKFYISTFYGISIFDCYRFDNSINDLIPEKYKSILKVYFNNRESNQENKMWILGKRWIGYIESNKIEILNDSFVLPTGSEYEYPSFVINRNNIIFFGNYYYSYYYNLITSELFPTSHKEGFTSDGSTSIYVDKENNIWMPGTRGIDKLNGLYLQNYNVFSGLNENEVSAIKEYEKGKFVIGHNSSATLMEKNKMIKIDFPLNKDGYPGDNRVLDICVDKEGTSWLACASGGLAKIQKNGKIKWIRFQHKNIVSTVAMDRVGDIYISSNTGIYLIKNDKFIETDKYKYAKQFYRKIIFTKEDELYLASSNGLAKSSRNDYYVIEQNSDAHLNNVYAVFEDNKGRVFIGTKGGLCILKNNRIEKFLENGFEINRAVYAIIQDRKGNYWFGTDDGVIKWNGFGKEKIISKRNGLSGMEVNRAALYEDTKGNIWIGTEMGMTCYRPEYDKEIIPIPEVFLYNAEDSEGNTYSLYQEQNFSSNIKSLYFNFRGISFYNENNLKYKIKLEGYDEDWYEVNQSQINKIRYSNLLPGDYKFLVSARNLSGDWGKISESSIITIQKPFYRSWWFILLTLIVFILLLYILYKLYIVSLYHKKLERQVSERTSELKKTENELRKSQAELEEKVLERTAELEKVNERLKEINASKDKFFSIIAHDMKSPFTGLLGYSELLKNEALTMDKEKILDYTNNLYKNLKSTYNLLENLLNWASLQTGKMQFNPEEVDLYLVTEGIFEILRANANAKDIKLINNIKDNININADVNMIKSVIYNLVSNAIKFTNRGGYVSVFNKRVDGYCEIYVSDNGVGIPSEDLNLLFKLESNYTTKGTEMEKGTGLGLLLCKELIERHNGKISVESKVGEGTTFIIKLPQIQQ